MGPRGIARLASAAFGACLFAIAAAWGAEKLLGLNPCAFCLLERWPWYAGAALSALAALLPRAATPPAVARSVLWLVVAAMIAAAALSLTHTGVEQHWWPDPLPECSAPDFAGLTMAQRLAAMPARPAKPCEDPDYFIPAIPVSMTQMGLAYALAVGAGITISLSRTKGRSRR